MRKITFLSCFAILAYLIFSVNYSYSFFWPKDFEKLEKQYYSIKTSRTPLTEEEKEIVQRYEIDKKMREDNKKAYEENIKKYWPDWVRLMPYSVSYEENIKKYWPDWEKWTISWEEVLKRTIESEPKLKKIVDENPNMTFYEAFEKFKKENPELIEERSKANRNVECNKESWLNLNIKNFKKNLKFLLKFFLNFRI